MSAGAPEVRVVKVRLDGADADALAVAELLARLLPELSQRRVQAGQVSPAYPNRRGPGARRYLDLYLLDGVDPAQAWTQPEQQPKPRPEQQAGPIALPAPSPTALDRQ